jgi:hypothetical protein
MVRIGIIGCSFGLLKGELSFLSNSGGKEYRPSLKIVVINSILSSSIVIFQIDALFYEVISHFETAREMVDLNWNIKF